MLLQSFHLDVVEILVGWIYPGGDIDRTPQFSGHLGKNERIKHVQFTDPCRGQQLTLCRSEVNLFKVAIFSTMFVCDPQHQEMITSTHGNVEHR